MGLGRQSVKKVSGGFWGGRILKIPNDGGSSNAVLHGILESRYLFFFNNEILTTKDSPVSPDLEYGIFKARIASRAAHRTIFEIVALPASTAFHIFCYVSNYTSDNARSRTWNHAVSSPIRIQGALVQGQLLLHRRRFAMD